MAVTLNHACIEVPVADLEKAARWYEHYIGLHRRINAPEHNYTRSQVIWFWEGIHVLGVEPDHYNGVSSQEFAHIGLVVGKHYDDLFERTKDYHVAHAFKRFSNYIRDPWGNRIELQRDAA